MGDNVIPCPIDKPCISLDNKAETPFSVTIFAKIVQVLDQNKVLTKQSLLKFMAQILLFFIFLKMAIFSGTL